MSQIAFHYRPSTRFRLGRCRVGPWIAAVAMLGLMSGCALFPRPTPEPAAQRVVERLNGHNAGLNSFKTVGRLTLSGNGGSAQSHRVAVAGQLPGKLRIDLLAPIGGSAASLACDGRHLFAVRHATGEYHQWPAGSASLKQFLGMPVTVADLLAFMTGRIALEKGRFPHLVPAHDGTMEQLLLNDRYGRVRQRVAIDADGRPVTAAWNDADGQTTLMLAMHAESEDADGYSLPRQIELHSPSGPRLTITLDRYMANPPIDSALFVLTRID